MRHKLCALFVIGALSVSLLYGCGNASTNEDKATDTNTALEVDEHAMVNGHEVSKEEFERQKALDGLELPIQIAEKYDDIDSGYTDVEDLRNADGSGKIIYHYDDDVTITYEKVGEAVYISKEEPVK